MMKTIYLLIAALVVVSLLYMIIISDQEDNETSFVIEKRITLLDLKGDQKGLILPLNEPVYKGAFEINREKRSSLQLKQGETAVFNNVPIHPKAELTFFIGVEGKNKADVELKIADPLNPGKGNPVVNTSCSIHSEDKNWRRFSQDLSAFSGSKLKIEFLLKNIEGEGEASVYVANPAILSDGKTIPKDRFPPISLEEIARDLIGEFKSTRIILSREDKPVKVGPLRLDPTKRTEADDQKMGIRVAPDSEFVYDQKVPKNAYLDYSLFSYPMKGGLNAIDPGNVEISICVNGTPHVKFRSDFININQPDVNPYERLIHRGRLDLSAFEDQVVSISFKTRFIDDIKTTDFEFAWWDLLLKKKVSIPRQLSSQKRPNLLVICVDALRADHLSCYGYERKTSPNLDTVAQKGLIFEKAMSPCSWTLPATASILTGLYPNTHGVLGNTRNYLVNSITTLPEFLVWKGVSTAAFSANALVCSAINFNQGFELFDEVCESAEGVNADLFAWLESCGSNRFFGYVHYMEPHSPYSAPGDHRQHFDPEYVETRDFSGALPERWRAGKVEKTFTQEEAEHLVNLYDSEIYYWDLQFKRLLDHLEKLSILNKTIIVVTADHGEEFFDHKGLGHGLTLYDEVIHVPLIIIDPRMRKGQRVSDYLEITTIFNSCVEMMEFKAPDFTQVKSLFPYNKGMSKKFSHIYSSTESNMPKLESRWACVIEPPYKLTYDLLNNRCELYNLEKDFKEKQELSKIESQKAESLKEKAINWYNESAAAFPQEYQPLTPELRKRLKELGYIDD